MTQKHPTDSGRIQTGSGILPFGSRFLFVVVIVLCYYLKGMYE